MNQDFSQQLKKLRMKDNERFDSLTKENFSDEEIHEQLAIYRAELFAQFEELSDSQTKLQETLSQLSLILNDLPQGICIIDKLSTRIEYTNPAGIELLQQLNDKQLLFSNYFAQAVCLESQAPMSFLSWIGIPEVHTVQCKIQDKYLELRKTIYQDNQLLISFHDITLQKVKENKMRIWQDYSVDGIHILDWNGQLVDYSPSFIDMLGYSYSEARHLNVRDWDAEIPEKKLLPTLHGLLKLSNKWSTFETKHKRKDGSVFDVEVSARAIKRDKHTYLYAASRKISEKKRLRSSLRAQNKLLKHSLQKADEASAAKTEFLANMSHELRTPMHAIRSFIVLAVKNTKNKTAIKYLNNAKTSADRLTELLNSLLDLSKIEAGKMQLERVPTQINALISQSVSTLVPLAQEKNIRIEFTPEEITRINIDPNLITQVMVNLLSNSIKYSSDNTHIKLIVKETPSLNLLVGIYDQGIGFPATEINKAFDKFYQTTRSKTGAGGTGLGLPICKEIIELHQGEIWIESPPADQSNGSAVFFKLPCKTDTTIDLLDSNQHEPQKVLVIDDDPTILALVNRFLEKESFEIITKDSGDDIEEIIYDYDPDVLICDIVIPDFDGLSIMSKAREIKPDLLIISITGDYELASVSDLIADKSLTKPLHKSQLINAISDIS